jgi:hypothetical protein
MKWNACGTHLLFLLGVGYGLLSTPRCSRVSRRLVKQPLATEPLRSAPQPPSTQILTMTRTSRARPKNERPRAAACAQGRAYKDGRFDSALWQRLLRIAVSRAALEARRALEGSDGFRSIGDQFGNWFEVRDCSSLPPFWLDAARTPHREGAIKAPVLGSPVLGHRRRVPRIHQR